MLFLSYFYTWQIFCAFPSVIETDKIRKENKDMNFNNFTIKSQEAVQEAVNLVQSRGQQAIEPVHVFKA